MDYVTRIDELLEASLSRETLTDEDKLCRHCDKGVWALWRCKDCCLGISMCRQCVRTTHSHNPFHRIEHWNGTFFRPAELWEVGTYLQVRHHTGVSLCENIMAQQHFMESLEKRKDDAEQEGRNKFNPSASASASFSGFSSAFGSASTSANPSAASTSASVSAYMDYDEDVQMSQPEGANYEADEEFIQYLERLRNDAELGDHDEHLPEEVNDEEDDDEIVDDLDEEQSDHPIPNHTLLNDFIADNGLGSSFSGPPRPVMGTYVRIVHTNGIHNIAMVTCDCHGDDVLPCDLLASRLLPASFQRIQTIFTAQLLDLFRLSNLELKASAYQFYHLLQRMTSPMAPAEVVNLYENFAE